MISLNPSHILRGSKKSPSLFTQLSLPHQTHRPEGGGDTGTNLSQWGDFIHRNVLFLCLGIKMSPLRTQEGSDGEKRDRGDTTEGQMQRMFVLFPSTHTVPHPLLSPSSPPFLAVCLLGAICHSTSE